MNMNNGMKRMGALMLALVLLVFASGCKGEPSPSSDGSVTDTSYSSDVSGEDMPTGGDNSNTPTDDTNNVDNPSGGDSTKPNTDVPSSSANQSRPSGSSTINDGVNPADYAGSTVTYATWRDPNLYEDGPVVKAFEKKYNIKVKVDLIGEESYTNTILGRIASGNAPDIYFSTYTFPYCLQALQPISNAKLDLSESIWDKALINLATVDGNPYLVDTVGNIWKEQDMVFYNKKIFRANGWTTPEEYYAAGKWTFAAMKKCMQQVASLGSGYTGGVVNLEALINSTGNGIINLENGKFVNGSKNEKTQAIIRWASEGRKEGWLGTTNLYTALNTFAEGKTGVAVLQAFGLKKNGYLRKMNANDIGFTYMPSWDGEPTKASSTVRGWGLCKGAKNPIAAGIFLRYYLDVNNYNTSSAFISSDAESFFFKLTSTNTDNKHFSFCYGTGVDGVTGSNSSHDYIGLPASSDPAQVATVIASYQNKLNADIGKLNALLK